ncbi:MAG: DNA polymerase I, partial [Syntrophomonadaceae bacterium]|nr:DNA polymerase I [Syntrophomonadaceae bacterium]
MLRLGEWGIDLQGVAGDIMLEAYLNNPGYPKMGLEDISHQLLNQLIVPSEDTTWWFCRRAEAVQLPHRLLPRLEEAELLPLYYEVELPLVRVLAEMERAGVALDASQLEQISRELGEKIEELAKRIHRLAGEEFNINSTKQLGFILFERLGLPAVKKTKTGYSTDAEVLEELAWQHEIVAEILEYRQLVKLKSTYVDGMRALVDPQTGKLHTSFNQAVTATGRLSSTEPNLQNIPIRLEAGRRLRKFFVPSEPGWLIMAADYSQIDLRVLAHFSGDEALIRAFVEGRDIHTHTAAKVFGIPEDKVTADLRRAAKAVNFGIVYGISDFGLGRQLGISRAEARRFIDQYLRNYPGVHRFMEEIVREAREKGYVTTLLKRRRYLPELFSSNRTVRGFGERAALNTPIQGSASDIIKVAMLKVDRLIKGQGLSARMLLQVHDELIFETPPGELAALAAGVKEAMETAAALRVPLVADLKCGSNWYDLQPLDLQQL